MAGEQANGIETLDIESFAGYSRFEIELEFVQSLSNPQYLQHLAAQKYFDDDDFLRYLDYLQYFREPEYLRYLQWPAPTLRALELLQEAPFRRDILRDDIVQAMMNQGYDAVLTNSSRSEGP